jgi:nucleotide-binding universal stress UspA family protein
MKIVIGVDESPSAQAAVDFVKGVDWPAGTQVELVCALTPGGSAQVLTALPDARRVLKLAEQERRLQQQMVARYALELESMGVTTSALSPEGDPRVVLSEAARAGHADLLVVGAHGCSGLSRMVPGSVVSHLIVHSPCSVLVVKRPGRD